MASSHNQNFDSANQMQSHAPQFYQEQHQPDMVDHSISDIIQAKRDADERKLAIQNGEEEGDETIGAFVKQKYAALIAGIAGPQQKQKGSTRQKLPIANVSTRTRIASLRGRPPVSINAFLIPITCIICIAGCCYVFNIATNVGKHTDTSPLSTLMENGAYHEAKRFLENKQSTGAELSKTELEALGRVYLNLAKDEKDEGNDANALALLKKIPAKTSSYRESLKLMKQLTKAPKKSKR
jgi:hypothetical protein